MKTLNSKGRENLEAHVPQQVCNVKCIKYKCNNLLYAEYTAMQIALGALIYLFVSLNCLSFSSLFQNWCENITVVPVSPKGITIYT